MTLGLALDGDGLTRADLNVIARRDPGVYAPFCLAGALAGYDKERDPPLTRRDMRLVMTRVCVEANRRGYIRPGGGSNAAALDALVKKETLRLIHSGVIHPTAAS